MQTDLADQLLVLLRDDDPEIRCATALVLGRLRPVDDRIFAALRDAYDSHDKTQRAYFLDALAATERLDAMGPIIDILAQQSSLSDQAVGIVHDFGHPALAAIAAAHEGHAAWRSGAFIKAVAGIPHRDAVEMLCRRVEDAPWDQARATAIFWHENVDRYPDDAVTCLRDWVTEYLERPRSLQTPHTIVSALRIAIDAGVVDLPNRLRPYLDPSHDPTVRRHALVVLGEANADEHESPGLQVELTDYLDDGDFDGIAGPALSAVSALRHATWTPESLTPLMRSRHPSVVGFALEQLARCTGDARERLDDLLTGDERIVRVGAAHALRLVPDAKPAMLDVLFTNFYPDVREIVADHLAEITDTLDDADRDRLFKHFVASCRRKPKTSDTTSDTTSDATPAPSRVAPSEPDVVVLRLLVRLHRDRFNERLLTEVDRLGSERRADAVDLLEIVVRNRTATEETRVVLARLHLHTAGDNLGANHPPFKRCVNLLSPLARTFGYDLKSRLRDEPFTDDQILALAAALSEKGPADRAVSSDLLDRVISNRLSESDAARYDAVRERLATRPPSDDTAST